MNAPAGAARHSDGPIPVRQRWHHHRVDRPCRRDDRLRPFRSWWRGTKLGLGLASIWGIGRASAPAADASRARVPARRSPTNSAWLGSRRSGLALALQRRPRSSKPSSPSTQRSAWADALGLCHADGPGAEARAYQRTGRDLSTSPMFRDAFRRHRCLVVADGFYEWRKNDGRRKTPFFVRLRSGRPFGFAGIWSMKHDDKGTRLATCAIVTCPPNELVAKIHDRMPVILPPGERDRWLEPTTSEAELRELLVPLPTEDLEAYEVSALVNSPANDSPECVRRVE